MDKSRGIYCKHLEKKLPKVSRQSIDAWNAGGHIERYSFKSIIDNRDIPEYEIEQKLIKFGLSPYEVELIMLRYIDGKDMLDIVREQGWLSVASANHYLKVALKKLRQGQFSL